MKRLLGALCVMAAGALALPAISEAATATGTLNVTATMSNTCSVSSPTLNFGDVTGISFPSATATLGVTCTSGAAYSIAMNQGMNAPVANGYRKIANGGNMTEYKLRHPNGSTDWGDDIYTYATGAPALYNGTGNGSAQNITVNGMIIGATNLAAGTYTDTVAITVSY